MRPTGTVRRVRYDPPHDGWKVQDHDVAAFRSDAWWLNAWKARAVLLPDWGDADRQPWRARWRPFVLSEDWSERGAGATLTAPEAYWSLKTGRTRRTRAEADHEVLAVMAAADLVGPAVLRPYGGRHLSPQVAGDGLVNAKRRTTLDEDDVLKAFRHFTLAWRALDSLAAEYVWRTLDGDGRPLTPLSRFQLGPWCALSENKATMFGYLLREGGIAEPRGPGGVHGLCRPAHPVDSQESRVQVSSGR